MFNDDAAPVNGLRVEDGRGEEPVPDRPVPVAAGAVPEAAGALEADGIGNGGATVPVPVGLLVAGALETSTEAVVSVAVGGAGLVAGALKLGGRVTPLSTAHFTGSTPLGQQNPLIRQNEPVGQGSGKQNHQSPALHACHIQLTTGYFLQPSEQHESPMLSS